MIDVLLKILGSIASIITIGIPIDNYLTTRKRESKLQIKGLYSSKRYDANYGRPIYEIIQITSFLGWLFVKPLYVYRDHNYVVRLSFSRYHLNAIFGKWTNIKDKHHQGNCGWNFEDGKMIGFWSSTTISGVIEYGRWDLKKIDKAEEKILREELFPSLHKRVQRYFICRKHKSICENIIQKHKSSNCDIFTSKNNHDYSIKKNVFNPKFGKISVPLIDLILSRKLTPNTFLDWGAGCGFYAIEIAYGLVNSNKDCRIFAIENDTSAIECSMANIATHKMGEKIKILASSRISDSNELRNIFFDLIVANLPFTKPEKMIGSKNETMYSSFCATPALILNFCFEIKNSLEFDGKAFITFGESGNRVLLELCLELVDLKAEQILTIDKSSGATDDTFYVFEILHK